MAIALIAWGVNFGSPIVTGIGHAIFTLFQDVGSCVAFGRLLCFAGSPSLCKIDLGMRHAAPITHPPPRLRPKATHSLLWLAAVVTVVAGWSVTEGESGSPSGRRPGVQNSRQKP